MLSNCIGDLLIAKIEGKKIRTQLIQPKKLHALDKQSKGSPADDVMTRIENEIILFARSELENILSSKISNFLLQETEGKRKKFFEYEAFWEIYSFFGRFTANSRQEHLRKVKHYEQKWNSKCDDCGEKSDSLEDWNLHLPSKSHRDAMKSYKGDGYLLE